MVAISTSLVVRPTPTVAREISVQYNDKNKYSNSVVIVIIVYNERKCWHQRNVILIVD